MQMPCGKLRQEAPGLGGWREPGRKARLLVDSDHHCPWTSSVFILRATGRSHQRTWSRRISSTPSSKRPRGLSVVSHFRVWFCSAAPGPSARCAFWAKRAEPRGDCCPLLETEDAAVGNVAKAATRSRARGTSVGDRQGAAAEEERPSGCRTGATTPTNTGPGCDNAPGCPWDRCCCPLLDTAPPTGVEPGALPLSPSPSPFFIFNSESGSC